MAKLVVCPEKFFDSQNGTLTENFFGDGGGGGGRRKKILNRGTKVAEKGPRHKIYLRAPCSSVTLLHGEAIQSLGESISNVNEVLSELKDFVYKNSKLNIETNIVDSICAGIVGEADQHIITDNFN